MKLCYLIMSLLFVGINGQYKVCAPPSVTNDQCSNLQRGNSPVSCVRVEDSVDCVVKIQKKLADFGAFSAEETFLLKEIILESPGVGVISQLRHVDRITDKFAFQAVSVVRSSHTGGLAGLRGKNYCLPEFSRTTENLWSNLVLKTFESKVAPATECVTGSESPAEDEAIAVSSFFGAACRPGEWVLNKTVDAKLKEKYPSLCQLCNIEDPKKSSCHYVLPVDPSPRSGQDTSAHSASLQCLTEGRGDVTYLAWDHVNTYFTARPDEINNYKLLCPDGSLQKINFDSEVLGNCSWVSQHWGAIISGRGVSEELRSALKLWISDTSTFRETWNDSLKSILVKDSHALVALDAVQDLLTYTAGRPAISYGNDACRPAVRWCTMSEENMKCRWMRIAALVSGIKPALQCTQAATQAECLQYISRDNADIVSIDSKYGYLARHPYNLTAVMYHETNRANSSRVAALVHVDSKISRFENLRGKKACFSEYGGLAWLAFVEAARKNGIIPSNQCDFAKGVSDVFSDSCAPGALNTFNDPSREGNPSNLCSLCQSLNNAQDNCSDSNTNQFYGDAGAIKCLNSKAGDIAILQVQDIEGYLKTNNINKQNFNVLCKNNSLGPSTDILNVGDDCALSVTVTSEVVIRRDSTQRLSIQLLLEQLDDLFGYSSKSNINFKIFGPFDGVKDLLFKDSSVGLTSGDSDNVYVKNYVELFAHTEKCSTGSGAGIIFSHQLLTLLAPVLVMLIPSLF